MSEEASFEALLARVAGDEGPWQRRTLARVSLAALLMGAHSLAAVVQTATPAHRCAEPPSLLPLRLPPGAYIPTEVTADGRRRQDSCHMLNVSVSTHGELLNVSGAVPCERFSFDRQPYGRTVAVEWELVCRRAPLVAAVQSTFMLAVLVGCLLSGALSDVFGRRAVAWWCSLMTPLASLAVTGASSLTVFLVLRAVLGLLLPGTFVCLLVLSTETVGPAARGVYGILYQLPFDAGLILTALAAMGTGTWRELQLLLSVPALPLPLLLRSLPESPRWLLGRGRLAEAADVLETIAEGNGRPAPDRSRLLRQLAACQRAEGALLGAGRSHKARRSWCAAACGDFVQLFATPRMRAISLACFWCLLVDGLIAYGISEDAPHLGGSAYTALLLSGGVGLLAIVGALLLSGCLGRRPTVIVAGLVTALPCAALLAVPPRWRWARLALAMVARLAVSAGQKVQNLYSTELFPTALRSTGFGVGATCTRLGAVLAPLVIAAAGGAYWGAPAAVFAACALLAAAAAFRLPETRGRRLPESVDDVECWEM
ncbi:Solute carrier family 22 member 7 [Amphibalanus amphitrite]|uniref:Solute carrier family 22 member 7 n=1 Tax=Amphibalanus amphitrite TaxID=1232801 RepID=A0A6A4VRA3_AMPAM|nr:solute carrier family 22 member 7-like [Amphibalanus amphitrite]KAF0291751.1 Solute carrier family 22 member 7 [Amphibalanus amphitrite]